MEGIFVTGTCTNVGKTVVAAGLLKALHGEKKVAYWKPVQTGTIVGDDTQEVKSLTGISTPDAIVEPCYRFPDPLSPHMAAQKWGKKVELSTLVDTYKKESAKGTYLIIEGAGGLLVPYNDTTLQIDFIVETGLPLLIVGEDRVGMINQVLLTVRAARERKIPIAGVVLSHARGSLGNAPAISQFGQVEVLAEIPPMNDKRSLVANIGGHDRLRALVGAKRPLL